MDLIKYFDLTKKTREEDMDKASREIRALMTTTYDNKTSTVVVTLEMEIRSSRRMRSTGLSGSWTFSCV